jgi:8-oxo-dGTP pyrophosphatase MutT (NUDIX family)
MQRLSAGVVVVRCGADGVRYLLLRCYHYWDFPKGEVDTGELPLAAAQREVAEESGLKDLRFRWGEKYYETLPYAGGKTARYYLAENHEGVVVLGVNPELGRPEHQEHRWVSLVEAERLLNDRVRGVLHWAARLIGDNSIPAPR